jgi:ketosteroid isomerase-like protein
MGATEPEQVIEHFVKRFNSGDIDGILDELYEDGCVMVPALGQTAVGKAAIREVLQGFLALNGTISVLGAAAARNGELALTHSKWRLDIPGGEPMQATTAEVVRLQPDGSWKYILDNPFGGAILEP